MNRSEGQLPNSIILNHKDHFVQVNLHNSETGSDSEALIETNMGHKSQTNGMLKKNETLERESLGCCSLIFYSSVFLMLDVWKQVASYGMKYFNNNIYPVPQTKIVAITEVMKCLCFLALVLLNGNIKNFRVSAWYAVPSVIYAINNNIYYYALHFATPPVWNILIQLRILFTAFTYRLLFKRTVTGTQWLGLGLLVSAVILTNFTGGQTLLGQDQKLIVALCLATLGSCTSVIGTLTMEYLFKNDNRSFPEMQLQLYGFGSIATWILYGLEWSSTPEPPNKGDPGMVHLMVTGCIILSCASGVAVAYIVKKLDNIVKLYTQALSNMLTSIACTIFFPDHFHINLRFLACLLLMFVSITLYESKTVDLKALVSKAKQWVAKATLRDWVVLLIASPLVIVILYFFLL